MHRLAYIFPIFTVGVLVVLFRNYDQWWVYLVLLALVELFLWLIIRRASRTKEYLSGYAVNIQHHEPWVERVVRTETYTDSKGNTRTRQVVEYHHHPDVWLMELNTGIEVYISSKTYHHYRRIWDMPEHWINPPHINCVSGGGGQLYEWNGVHEDAATHTYKGLYINYVTNSNSIFRLEKVTKKDVEEYGLIEYPKFDSSLLETDVILCSPNLPEEMAFSDTKQRYFHLINAFAGSKRQIHIFVLVFDAKQGIATALKQQAYWQGGNKNEFVVCLGIDCESKSSQPTVEWCKAFSWCDAPRLESATESYFIEHKALDMRDFASWLAVNLDLWKRKEFSDFKYLGVQLSTGRKVLVSFVTVLFCAIIVVVTSAVADAYRQNDYSGTERDYSGYGYVLLDKIIRNNHY
jgi:hypothetical protein